MSSPPKEPAPRRRSTGAESRNPLAFKVMAAVVFVFLLLPIAVVVLMSVNSGEFLTFPPQGFSTRWIVRFFESDSLRNGFLYSSVVAGLTGILATAIGTMVAIWLVGAIRARRSSASLVALALLTPIILPGVSIGFGLFLVAFNIGVHQSTPLLVLAHTAVSLPFAVIVISAMLYRLDPDLERAARTLGYGPWGAFRRVTLPLAIPGVSAGFLFALIISFGQSGLSVFLLPPNTQTLPLALYQYIRFQFDPTPAAAGTISIVLVVVVTLALNYLTPIGRLSSRRLN